MRTIVAKQYIWDPVPVIILILQWVSLFLLYREKLARAQSGALDGQA